MATFMEKASIQVKEKYSLLKNYIAETLGADFYIKYSWTHIKDDTAEDKELNSRPLSANDRVIDVVLIMDCTGSMGTWMELSKKTFGKCIAEVQEENPDFLVRTAFVGYRDFGDGNTIFAVRDFTLDLESVIALLKSQSASGGADTAEDVQGALLQALDLKWRKNSVKHVFFCADAQAHGRSYNGTGSSDNYPDGNPAGLILEEQMQEFSDNNIGFSFIRVMDEPQRMITVMTESYDKGKNPGQFKIIDIRKSIAEANAKSEQTTTDGGIVETAFAHQTAVHILESVALRAKKLGW